MSANKFAIGQTVDFDARVTPISRPKGPYQVVRVLPAEDANSRTYRIKSTSEPFERSAKEHEIVAVGPPLAERAPNAAQWVGADPVRRRQSTHPFRS